MESKRCVQRRQGDSVGRQGGLADVGCEYHGSRGRGEVCESVVSERRLTRARSRRRASVLYKRRKGAHVSAPFGSHGIGMSPALDAVIWDRSIPIPTATRLQTSRSRTFAQRVSDAIVH